MKEIRNFNDYMQALFRIVELMRSSQLTPSQEFEKEFLFQAIEQYSSIQNN